MAEKKTYKLQDVHLEEDELDSEDGPGVKKEIEKECSLGFLNGVLLVGAQICASGDGGQCGMKVFYNGEEIKEILETMPEELQRLDDVECEGDQKIEDARAATVHNEGYDIFRMVDGSGEEMHFHVPTADMILGVKWACSFFEKEDPNYFIDALFLNGQRIQNIKAHIDDLTSSQGLSSKTDKLDV